MRQVLRAVDGPALDRAGCVLPLLSDRLVRGHRLSERGIGCRASDSLSLREFPGLSLEEQTPDHSTLSTTRRRMSPGTHEAVFRWVLRRVAAEGLLSGKTLGVDATTLEANAALRSIVRRGNGAS